MQKMKSVPNNHIEQLTQPEFQCMKSSVCGRLVAFSSTWSFARTMENWIYFPFSQIPAVHRLQTIDWKKERNFNFFQFQMNHNRWNCLGSLFQKYFFFRFVVKKQIDMVIVHQFIELKFIGSPNSDKKIHF